MTIETTHKGYTIRYCEEDNTWGCTELRMHAPSLRNLKDKLDEMQRQARRLSLPAMLVRDRFHVEKVGTPVTITMLDPSGKDVWVIRSDKRREKISIDTMAPDTDEAKLAVEMYKAAVAAENAARQQTTAKFNEIPRMTQEMIRAATSTDTTE